MCTRNDPLVFPAAIRRPPRLTLAEDQDTGDTCNDADDVADNEHHHGHEHKDSLKMKQTVCDTLCSEAQVETVLYFSPLATMINTWRFSLRAIFMKWTELRGLASSMLRASRQPPKCLSGRWSAVDDAERFLLERFFGQIWSWCSRKHGAPRKLFITARCLMALDVEGELDATSYREKITRWKREPLSAISHPVWQTMGVRYNVRKPLCHFCRFLM